MLAEFSIIPIGQGESLSKYVAKAIDIIDHSGLKYRTTAMGTLVEGDWDKVMRLIKRCHTALSKEANRIETHIAIDWRKGDRGAMERKIQSVEKRLRRKIKA